MNLGCEPSKQVQVVLLFAFLLVACDVVCASLQFGFE